MSSNISKQALEDKIVNVVDRVGGIRSTALLAGVTPNHTTADAVMLEEKAIKIGIAQALIDNLTPAPDGLVVRDLLPDLDLMQDSNVAITRRDWYQPTSATWLSAGINTDVNTYLTNTNCNNDRKVYVFYGVRATNTGPGDQSTTIGVSSITFKRGSATKIVDIWQIEEIDSQAQRVLYARTPILFRTRDNQQIAFRPAPKGSGTNDNLMLLCKVIERAADTLTG